MPPRVGPGRGRLGDSDTSALHVLPTTDSRESQYAIHFPSNVDHTFELWAYPQSGPLYTKERHSEDC